MENTYCLESPVGDEFSLICAVQVGEAMGLPIFHHKGTMMDQTTEEGLPRVVPCDW